jgi:hypothetical protein
MERLQEHVLPRLSRMDRSPGAWCHRGGLDKPMSGCLEAGGADVTRRNQ